MKLFKAMATIAGFTMASRVAGMARDMITASVLGAGPIADAFFVALKLPNFFRRVAAEGAFSVSFVPLYTKTVSQEGEAAAGEFSGQVFSVLLLILSVFSVLVVALMPWVIHAIAPGFHEGSERYHYAVIMTQMTFPYLLLMSLVTLFGGMLNAHHRFGPFSAAPIIFNLTLIFFMLVLTPYFPSAGHAMSVGVTTSGIIQLAMMVYFIRKNNIRFVWQKPQLGEKTRRLFRLMGPGVVSAGIFQVNMFVDMMVASLLSVGAISFLYYADRLNQLPLSLAGIAIGTALLPMLSKALAENNHDESRSMFNRSLELCFLVALPAAVALLIVPVPMIATLFEHGEFGRAQTLQTSYVLMGYSLGLPAYVASKVFMTAFWAHQDTMTPVKISVVTAILNIILCLTLIGFIGVAGISLATGLVGWVQVYLLYRELKGKEALEFDERLRMVFPKIVLSSCIMAIVLSLLGYVLRDYFSGSLWTEILALVALLGGGAITYALAIHASGALNLKEIKTYLKR